MVGFAGGLAGGAVVSIIIKGIDNFSTTFKSAQTGVGKLGTIAKAGGVAMAAGLAIGAVALVGIGKSSLKTASDFEETSAKFGTVFSSISEESNAVAKDLQENFGLSGLASKQLLSDTGDLLTGFGFSQEAALDLSEEVNKLAVDLASFTNFAGGAEGASQALTKALLGERESVKSLGISILEADVQAKVLENTQQGLTFESERQAKAFATLQIAQEQSKNAAGDFSRTSGGFANQVRIMNSAIEDASVELGTAFLPVATELVGVIISDLLPAIKPLIPIIGEALASAIKLIGPLLGVLVEALVTLASVLFEEVFPALEPLIPTLIDLIPPIAEVIAAFLPLISLILPPLVGLLNLLLPVLGFILNLLAAGIKTVVGFVDVIDAWARVFIDDLAGSIDTVIDKLSGLWDWINKVIDVIVDLGKKFLAAPFNLGKLVFGAVQTLLGFAEGGIVLGPTAALIGEAGPEAVIPLDRLEGLGGGGGGMVINIENIFGTDPDQIAEALEETLTTMVTQ